MIGKSQGETEIPLTYTCPLILPYLALKSADVAFRACARKLVFKREVRR
jgi:hypothetical protein